MGLWGTLGKIGSIAAAPFTGGTSLAWLPAAMVGGGVAADVLTRGGKKNKKKGNVSGLSPLDAQRESEAFEDLDKYNPLLFDQATDFLGRGGQAGQQAFDYYSSLMEGDPAKRAELLAPEIEGIQKAYQGGLEQVERFGPRGGERDRALVESRLGKAGDMARLMTSVRPRAASALAGLSTGQTGLGLSAAGLGMEIPRINLDHLYRKWAVERGIGAQNKRALGEGIGAIAARLPWDKWLGGIFGGGKGGGKN